MQPPLKRKAHAVATIEDESGESNLDAEFLLQSVVVPTTAVSLVMRHALPSIGTIVFTQLVAEFAFPEVTWAAAVAAHQADASALRAVTMLHNRRVPQYRIQEHLGAHALKTIMDTAAAHGFLAVVKYLHDAEGLDGCTTYAMDNAAVNGYYEIVQFLHEHRTEGCTADAISGASANGDLKMVRYLHEVVQAEFDYEAAASAAVGNHMEVLKYIHVMYMDLTEEERRTGLYWTVNAMDRAVFQGLLDIVKWLDANCDVKCSDDTLVLLVAHCEHISVEEKLKMLQFFHGQNYSSMYWDQTLDTAARGGSLELVQFLHENRSEGCTTAAMDSAAMFGHLEVLRFLHEHRTEGCTEAAFERAAAQGHLEVVKFLHENRTEGCVQRAASQAVDESQEEVLAYLQSISCRGSCEECNLSQSYLTE